MIRRSGFSALYSIIAAVIVFCHRASSAEEPILPTQEGPRMLQEQGAGEGPALHPELGLLTSGGGHIYRRDRAGKVSVYRENAGTNGLLFDRDGRLVMCEPARRRVSRLEKDGSLKVLADAYEGQRFNQPNDLTIDLQGRIYFSDPQYGDRSKMEMEDS